LWSIATRLRRATGGNASGHSHTLAVGPLQEVGDAAVGIEDIE
jgi:hypothetical protein